LEFRKVKQSPTFLSPTTSADGLQASRQLSQKNFASFFAIVLFDKIRKGCKARVTSFVEFIFVRGGKKCWRVSIMHKSGHLSRKYSANSGLPIYGVVFSAWEKMFFQLALNVSVSRFVIVIGLSSPDIYNTRPCLTLSICPFTPCIVPPFVTALVNAHNRKVFPIAYTPCTEFNSPLTNTFFHNQSYSLTTTSTHSKGVTFTVFSFSEPP
jgi:hypothetical protein